MPGSLPLFSSRRVMLLLVLVAAVFTTTYLRIGISRVLYPYALDFIEDGMLMQAWQVAQEQPVFVPPNADFVPHVYMPFYTWLGGQLFKVTGPAFWPLRLLSLLATLGTAVLLAIITNKESGDKWLAFTAAGLFLAGYRLAGGWYDLARVDALFVFLALAGVMMAVYKAASAWGMIGAGLLLGLAFLTKQQGLFLTGAVVGYLLLCRHRRLWLLLAVFGVVTAITLIVLQQTSRGWFAYYMISVAFASPWSTWGRLVVGAMVLIGFLVFGLFWWGNKWDWLRRRPWPLFMATAVFMTFSGLAPEGGNLNNVIPGYAFICLLPALLVKERPHLPPKAWELIKWGLPLVILMQFGFTRFNPLNTPQQYVPSAAMWAAGDELIERLTAVHGEVFVMMHPYYALLANKTPTVHIQTLWHARRHGQDPLPTDLTARIENQAYALIISDNSPYFETEPALLKLIEAHYQPVMTLNSTQSAPMLSGLITRPQIVYIPKN